MPTKVLEQIGRNLPRQQDRVALAATSKSMRETLSEQIRLVDALGLEHRRHQHLPTFEELLMRMNRLPEPQRGQAMLLVLEEASQRGYITADRLQVLATAVNALPEHQQPPAVEALTALRERLFRDSVTTLDQIMTAVARIRAKDPHKLGVVREMRNPPDGRRSKDDAIDWITNAINPQGRLIPGAPELRGLALLRTSAAADHQAKVSEFVKLIDDRNPPPSRRGRAQGRAAPTSRPARAARNAPAADRPGLTTASAPPNQQAAQPRRTAQRQQAPSQQAAPAQAHHHLVGETTAGMAPQPSQALWRLDAAVALTRRDGVSHEQAEQAFGLPPQSLTQTLPESSRWLGPLIQRLPFEQAQHLIERTRAIEERLAARDEPPMEFLLRDHPERLQFLAGPDRGTVITLRDQLSLLQPREPQGGG